MSTITSFVEYPVKVKHQSSADFLLMFFFADETMRYGQIFSISDGAIKCYLNSSPYGEYGTTFTFYINEFSVVFPLDNDFDHITVRNDIELNQVRFYINGVLTKTVNGVLPSADKTNFICGPTKTVDLFDVRLFCGSDVLNITEETLLYYVTNVNDGGADKFLPYA